MQRKKAEQYVYNINRSKCNEEKSEGNKRNEKQANNMQTKPNKKRMEITVMDRAGHHTPDQKREIISIRCREGMKQTVGQFGYQREMAKCVNVKPIYPKFCAVVRKIKFENANLKAI